MALQVKVKSSQGSKRIEFKCDAAEGNVWISETPNGVLRIALYGKGFFEIENNTEEIQ